jgi:histidine triad (HIT) family protein
MMNGECSMCRLLDRYESGDEKFRVVYESEHSLAIHATRPFAEVHIMILTKKHIPSLFDITAEDGEIVADICRAVRVASDEVFALKGGCKLEMYTGRFPTFDAVKHFHCHVIFDSSVD